MINVHFNRINSPILHFLFLALSVFLLFLLGQAVASSTLATASDSASFLSQNRSEGLGKFPLDITHRISHNSILNSTLFFDDFKGDLSQWSNMIGTWYIDQEQLVGQGIGGDIGGWIYAGDSSWTDYSLQVEVYFIDGNASLVLRSTGHSQNEYRLDFVMQAGEINGYFTGSKYQDGIWYDMGTKMSLVPITDPSIIRVQVSSNYQVIFINGQYAGIFEDPDPLTSGRIGLGVIWDVIARFDDVLVTTYPPLQMLPPKQAEFGTSGDSVAYMIELENHTGVTDTFNLEVLPGSVWTTTLSSEQVGPINDGGMITFTTWVNIPPSAQPGNFDLATIQATSVTSPTVYTTTAQLNTYVTSGKIGYVASTLNQLSLVDTVLHTVFESIDLKLYNCSYPDRIELSPNAAHLYVFCSGWRILVFKTSDNSLVTIINLPDGGDHGRIAFTRDGTHALVSASGLEQVYVIDTATYEIVNTIQTIMVDYLASHPYLPYIYLAGQNLLNSTGQVQVIDSNSFTVIDTIFLLAYVWDVQPSPDGQWLYAAAREQYGYHTVLYKIDTQTNQVVDSISNLGELTRIQVTPDGSRLFAAASTDYIQVIDTANLTYVGNFYIGGEIDGMEFTDDGSELFIGNHTIYITVIATENLSVIYKIPLPMIDSGDIVINPQVRDFYMGKSVNPPEATHSGLVNYTIALGNFRTSDKNDIVITDTLPVQLIYQEGSLHATSGSYEYQNGTITWTGPITSSNAVQIYFDARVTSDAPIGNSITNTAVISTATDVFLRGAVVDVVMARVLLPCVLKPCPPIFSDDFSNPASGWSIEGGSDYWMGYTAGEYFISVNPGWIAWSMRDFGASDYRVEVDALPAVNLDGALGIIFGATNDGFYLFEISDGWYSLWRIDAQSWYWGTLIDWTYSPALHPGYQTNRMEVEKVGPVITIYANGEMLGYAIDWMYQGTWVGMTSEAGWIYFDGRFDNFAIYSGICMDIYTVPPPLINGVSSDAMWIEPGTRPSRP